MTQRFRRYCDKVFGLTERLQIIRDDRPKPIIASGRVWLFALFMFASKTRSLHAAECRSRVSNHSRFASVPRPSADTLGRVFARMDTESLRRGLSSLNHKLKRNKSLKSHEKLFFAAVDGHELFNSKSRCCESCLTRKLTTNDREATEHYHRITVCHLVGAGLALPLDAEPILPGEDEKASARRLLERVFKNYARFFDVVIGDALYLDRSFVSFVKSHNKHLVSVLKNNNPSLLEDAQGLFNAIPPKINRKDSSEEVVIWDEENFQTREGCLPLRRHLFQRERIQDKTNRGKTHPGNRRASPVVGHHASAGSSWIRVSQVDSPQEMGDQKQSLRRSFDSLEHGPLLQTPPYCHSQLHSDAIRRLHSGSKLLPEKS